MRVYKITTCDKCCRKQEGPRLSLFRNVGVMSYKMKRLVTLGKDITNTD